MAYRNIVTEGDSILKKKSRKIEKIDDRTKTLIDDMKETMYKNDGVGLAAVQVGVLKQLFIVDIGEGIFIFINPEIEKVSGECLDNEGCLSFPGKTYQVRRPEKIKVKALNENGEEFELEAEGLFARAICHENDHLNGIVFLDRVKMEDQDEER
ncbi:MAG: peptide deformylase [Clostridia bacterium]|nr:peptide deformylase [Clostridia bacterium]